jgi:hypothetical protein
MAVVSITADNLRVAEANATNDTGTWGNDGGGGGVADEPDFYYQGGTGAFTAQSRKVSTSRIGRNYTHGSGTDMTATDRATCLMKLQVTNKDALLSRTSPSAGLKVGSGSSAHYEYYLWGNDNYPKRGGWQLIAVDPNVSGYRNATTGSPSLTGVLYWSFLADFSATSKSENIMIDAIDVGAGLHLTGGDGVSTDGVFQDFIDSDEGTSGNEWGYVSTEGDFILINGRLSIGENTSETAVATGFTDSAQVLAWRNGLVATGYNKLRLNLGSATTVIDISDCFLKGQGEENNAAGRGYTTTEDTRPQLEVTGTSGSATLDGNSFDNFGTIDLNGAVTFTNNIIRTSGQIDLNAGNCDMTGTSVLTAAIAADASAVVWDSSTDPDGYLEDMIFTKGANAHHAVEFGTSSPTSITVRGLESSGFNASNSQNDSFFYVARTSGTVTINVVGGTGNFSYKSAGATVVIVIDPVTTQITVKDINTGALLQNARVRLTVKDGTNFPYQDVVTITSSGTTATVTHTAHGLATNDYILIQDADQERYNGCFQITVTGVNTYTYTMTATATSPATGTILATFAYFNELTNASGVVTDTRSISASQDVEGWVRKSTTVGELYKQSPIDEIISNTIGLTLNIQLIPDE